MLSPIQQLFLLWLDTLEGSSESLSERVSLRPDIKRKASRPKFFYPYPSILGGLNYARLRCESFFLINDYLISLT